MIKLFIFESVEDARKFDEEKHVVLDAVSISPAAERVAPTPMAEERTVRHYKKRTAKVSRQQGKRRPPSCKTCGEPGHLAKTCPESRREMEKVKVGDDGPLAGVEEGDGAKPVLTCHICEDDHLTRDCPEFTAKVAELRGRGMDSLQIAANLKIRLKDIPVE